MLFRSNGTYDYASLINSKDGAALESRITNHTMSGNITICLYYSRDRYTLLLEKGEYIQSVTGAGEYKVGQSMAINALLEDNAPGYTNSWVNWTSNNTELLRNQGNLNTRIIMPTGNITLTANGTRNANKYNVTLNNQNATTTGTKTAKVTYGSAMPNISVPKKTGYIFAKLYL